MKQYIAKRVIAEANYIVESGATVREVGKEFGVGKSTVHKDMRDRLILLDKNLFNKVDKVLCFNLSERNIRGGNATKMKYEKAK